VIKTNQYPSTIYKNFSFKQKDFSLHFVALKMTMFLGEKAWLILAAKLPISTTP